MFLLCFSLSSSICYLCGSRLLSHWRTTVPVSSTQSNRISSFRWKLVRLMSRRTHRSRFQDQVPGCRGSVLSKVLFSTRKTIAFPTIGKGGCVQVKVVSRICLVLRLLFVQIRCAMADGSVSLICSLACSPSRIITASSTTHFVLLMGLDATNVVGCLPSSIVDISPQRSGTAGRPWFGRIRKFHM